MDFDITVIKHTDFKLPRWLITGYSKQSLNGLCILDINSVVRCFIHNKLPNVKRDGVLATVTVAAHSIYQWEIFV